MDNRYKHPTIICLVRRRQIKNCMYTCPFSTRINLAVWRVLRFPFFFFSFFFFLFLSFSLSFFFSFFFPFYYFFTLFLPFLFLFILLLYICKDKRGKSIKHFGDFYIYKVSKMLTNVPRVCLLVLKCAFSQIAWMLAI